MKHLSYRQFKNIFGDLGVTAWTKFNWLSNGLPDGEYNGIKKVTYTALPNDALVQTGGFYWRMNVITTTPDKVWGYGFSNWPIIAVQQWGSRSRDLIAISSVVNIHIECVVTTKEAYNAYLKEHPLIIYYYDKNEWGGVVYDGSGLTLAACWYAENVFPTSRPPYGDIRDVQGYYAFVGNLGSTQSYADYPEDQLIGGNPSIPARINIKDAHYKTKTALLNDKFPRAIVYRLTATQSLSMQSEGESQEIDSDVVVVI